MAERCARLDRHAGHPADVKLHLDNVVGAGKGAQGCRGIAERGVDQHIVRRLVPHRRRARPQRVGHLRDPRQFLIFDDDRLGRVLRLCGGFGHEHRHRLADMAHLVGRQQHLRADKDRAAIGAGQLHIVAGRRHRGVRDRLEPVGKAILAGKDAEHPRHRHRLAAVDLDDPRMRMGRAHDRGIDLPRQGEIVAEPAAAGQQPLVLLAPHRLADRAEALQICPETLQICNVGRIIHCWRIIHRWPPNRAECNP